VGAPSRKPAHHLEPESWENGKLVRMKVTLDLPDELVKQLKLQAVHGGKKLKDAFADTLRAGLVIHEKPMDLVIKKNRKTGLPIVQCPSDAPARRMTTVEILALEHESGAQEDLERLGVSLRQ
jgi:plasmid stability protein